MHKEHVIALVRARLQGCHPGGVTFAILEEATRMENGYWYVPVQPSAQPPHTFEYYDALAEVETDLRLHAPLKIFLVPTLPEEPQVHASA